MPEHQIFIRSLLVSRWERGRVSQLYSKHHHEQDPVALRRDGRCAQKPIEGCPPFLTCFGSFPTSQGDHYRDWSSMVKGMPCRAHQWKCGHCFSEKVPLVMSSFSWDVDQAQGTLDKGERISKRGAEKWVTLLLHTQPWLVSTLKHSKHLKIKLSWRLGQTNCEITLQLLTLGMVEDFFRSGPTRGLVVISLLDPTVVLPSLRATSLSHSSFCSLSTLLAWGLLV